MNNPTAESTQDTTIDRRKNVAMREIFMPVVVAIIVGMGSSFFATYVSVNTLQLKIQYLEKNVDTLLQLVKDMNQNEIRIIKLENNNENISKRVDRLENAPMTGR
jgi:hypothetical protein